MQQTEIIHKAWSMSYELLISANAVEYLNIDVGTGE
jgi:hypothetical protein